MSKLDQALKQINWKKSEYFKWKFDIRYDQRREKKTEEELMKYVEVKTMNSFINWEKSEEYRALMQLLLQYRATQDFEVIYNVVSEKAQSGDEKAVKLFLDLQKQINSNVKIADKIFKKNEDEEDDDLEI